MPKVVRSRRKSKFARFIQEYRVEALAVALDVRPSALYHWIRGATTPRPAHSHVMLRLARERGIRLTMDDIYAHSRSIRERGFVPSLPAARQV